MRQEVATKLLEDGSRAHSVRTLLNELATIVRNTCRWTNANSNAQPFDIDTTANAKQRKAFELINAIRL